MTSLFFRKAAITMINHTKGDAEVRCRKVSYKNSAAYQAKHCRNLSL